MNLICHEKGKQSLDIATTLLECPYIDLEIAGKDKNNSLHLAASFGQPKIFAKILNKVAETSMVNNKNKEGNDILTLSICA